MPANRPRRIRVIIIIILMGPRARVQLENNIDGSVDERLLTNVARVLLMYENETEAAINANDAMLAVVHAFEAVDSYLESVDSPELSKLASLSDSLGDALDETNY